MYISAAISLLPAVLQAEKSGLETSKVWDEAAKAAIDRDNALALFPRFA
jgi:hypothetical protein